MNKRLSELTTKEKIGQLLQIAPFFFIKDLKIEVAGPVRDLHLDEEKIFHAGSVLGIGSPEEMIAVQSAYLKKSRHKIPLLFMADVIHGYKTIFPVPIAMASSFNEKLAFSCARVSAMEASSSGIHVTFSPMADLSRDPRWGRVVESFGEDPYLIAQMTEAMVKGYTNDGIKKDGNIASCVKHFAAYGAAEAGRDYNTVDLSRVSLYNDYLPAYKKALDAGSRLIMTSFNTIDRVPATVNSFLLRKVLREQWHSDAVTISDYDSLKQIISHGVAADMEEVAKRGMIAGLDIEMASSAYANHLEDLIDNGTVSTTLLDEAVSRILDLKEAIGLFDNPFKGASSALEKEIVLSKEHLEASLLAANESLVLLENDGILPLHKNVKIALIGRYSKSRSIVGPWSWHGRRDLHDSLEEVLSDNLVFVSDKANIIDFDLLENEQIKKADVILLAIGETEWQSGEAHSRSELSVPNNQDELLKLREITGKPVVSVLYNGRPLLLENLQKSNALIEAWFLGSMASHAIKNVLFGDINPSGKLPISFPRNVGQIPIYYNHLNTGRPYLGPNDHNEYVSRYLDVENTPLYPFGYGLSYSTFGYKNLVLSDNKVKKDETLFVSVDVENASKVDGQETVLLFIRDLFASISRPVQELKKYKKVLIKGNMTETITFELKKEDLGFYLESGEFITEKGRYQIMVGRSSADYLSLDFDLI